MPTDESSRIHLYTQPVSQEQSRKLIACLEAGANSISKTAQFTTGEELPENADILILAYLDSQDDDALYAFIKRVENQTSHERILILPKRFQTSKNHFPAALHDIRFQQHHLVFYETDICHEEVVSTVNNLAAEILVKKQRAAEQNAVKGRGLAALWSKTRVRTGIYLLPVFALLVWGFILVLPRTLTLLASNDSLRKVVSAPEMSSVWLREGFDPMDQSLWTQKHLFKGIHHLNIDTENTDLILSADNPIKEDFYSLQSTQTWPMDNLQAASMNFRIDTPAAEGAESLISEKIVNAENPALAVVCTIQPDTESGTIECFAQDEKQKVVLPNLMTFSLGESHTLVMVFIPSRYSMRFFLDDQFYGELGIPSVEYWRERYFSLQIESSLKNLKSGGYAARIENVALSQQP